MSPPGSTPAQVNVTVCGVPVAEVMSLVRLAQYGAALAGFVGTGVNVGGALGVAVGVASIDVSARLLMSRLSVRVDIKATIARPIRRTKRAIPN